MNYVKWAISQQHACFNQISHVLNKLAKLSLRI